MVRAAYNCKTHMHRLKFEQELPTSAPVIIARIQQENGENTEKPVDERHEPAGSDSRVVTKNFAEVERATESWLRKLENS